MPVDTLLPYTHPIPVQFPGQWAVSHTQVLSFPPKSISWNRDGSQLLVGGMCISLWSCDQDTNGGSGEGIRSVEWAEVWTCDMGRSVVHLKFSPDGTFFASAGEASRHNNCALYTSFVAFGGFIFFAATAVHTCT